jgi:hypothetical protein
MAREDSTGASAVEWQADSAQSPLDAQRAASEEAGLAGEHPELLVGAAFAGGFVLAQLLKRFGGGDG